MSRLVPGVHRLAAVLGTFERYRIVDVDRQVKIDGAVGIAWGFFTEEFQNKGLPPERVRVRFSLNKRSPSGA